MTGICASLNVSSKIFNTCSPKIFPFLQQWSTIGCIEMTMSLKLFRAGSSCLYRLKGNMNRAMLDYHLSRNRAKRYRAALQLHYISNSPSMLLNLRGILPCLNSARDS